MEEHMNYEQARQFILETSKSGSILGLESITRLMDELGNVQETLPVIHITGTNGKGSVGAYLASIFKEAGLRVGRYCSPAVFDPLEVWQYDGTNISQIEYAKVMSQVREACNEVCAKGNPMPTVFEIETAAAFVWFAQKKPDVVLLEVGMGGRTDATNVISQPMCSVMTTISRDHMQFLGDSLREITGVKAGIIKEGCPVFSAVQKQEVELVLCEYAHQKKSPIVFADETAVSQVIEEPGHLEFDYRLREEAVSIHADTVMAGRYQIHNIALALEIACYMLSRKHCSPQKRKEYMEQGIRKACWSGRFELLGTDPVFIIDGAHNEGAASELAKTLQNCFCHTPLTFIIGVLADKEHRKMLQIMLPYAAQVYTVTPDNARALQAECLAEEAAGCLPKALQSKVNIQACRSVEQAVTAALDSGHPVLAFGSLSYLKQVKRAYHDR